jgi:chromosome segregation ATPase
VPKLQQHIERLQAENRNLQHEVANLNTADYSLPNQQQQIQQLTSVINELAPNEQQRAEVEAQNATLIEQRSHIDVLEKALTNAQERIRERERQVIDAAGVADKCSHLQKLLDEAVKENQQARDEWSRQQAAMRSSVDTVQQTIQSTHLVSNLARIFAINTRF